MELLLAENGEEAYNIMKTKEPQLVFLDVMMPKMNGFEVCEKIRNELAHNKIYIILLTAKGQEADKEKGLLLGANEYITKPFDPDQIMDKAMEILNV